MTTRGQPAQDAFSPGMIAIINRAYGRALAAIGGGRTGADRRVALVRHVVGLARAGEQDEERLCLGALQALRHDEANALRPAAAAASHEPLDPSNAGAGQ